jgi:DNA-binding NtrC family response regulator
MLGIAAPSIEEWAKTQGTLLISGEPGTAKDVLAHAIHRSSSRADGPFVPLNCGAIPEVLLEVELFGHARGAAVAEARSRVGRVASARGGTLFLDEITRLPLSLQVKLLRLLQYQEFTASDDAQILSADVRIIAATSVPLAAAVQAATFREDLRTRLQEREVRCPALRERPSDAESLVHHYFLAAVKRLDRNDVIGISSSALQALRNHGWPGNLRELEDTLVKAVLVARAPEILLADLPDTVTKALRPCRVASTHPQLAGATAR